MANYKIGGATGMTVIKVHHMYNEYGDFITVDDDPFTYHKCQCDMSAEELINRIMAGEEPVVYLYGEYPETYEYDNFVEGVPANKVVVFHLVDFELPEEGFSGGATFYTRTLDGERVIMIVENEWRYYQTLVV